MKACFVYLTKPSNNTPDRLAGVKLMAKILEEVGGDKKLCRSVYMTTCDGAKKPSAADIAKNRDQFLADIGSEPVILVALGSSVMSPLTKGYYPISCCRGEPVPVTEDMPYPKGSLIYGMFDPIQVWNDPSCEDLFRRDIRHLVALMNGTPEKDPEVDTIIMHSADDIDTFRKMLPELWASLPEGERYLSIDCEWHGKNWLEPDHYIRTVQIGYAPGAAVIVELYKENEEFNNLSEWPRKAADKKKKTKECLSKPVCVCDDEPKVWEALKKLLQDEGHPIIGHNIIADWQWLLTFGVDIRNNVIFDTMLAEHLINSAGPFRLDEVAMRRTPYGRYNTAVDLWVHHHKDFCEEGYGAIPSDLLLPYGGADVDCVRLIMNAQLPILESYGMMNPRGPEDEYPSLLDSTLLNELATDELERNGLPVDRKRLTELIDAYQAMRAQLLSEITLMAMSLGMPEFNPNSQPQMRMLLFGKLGLTPIKTTGGQSWGDAIGGFEMDSADAPASSTDKSVLEMLQNSHPLVKKLLHFRRIDQTCKTWLRHPDENGEGGLEPLIWADGKLHASFLPTTSTGRYKTSNPNSQNFPKRAESYLTEIFGEGKVPPTLRTIVAPPKDFIMMECDFCQAELFTMANISGDQNMIRLLTTPGLDLHDSTTLSSFNMKMLDEKDNEVTEDDLVKLAADIGAESDEFQHYMKTMRYLQADGKIITRGAFKSGPRIGAKSLNFGIPYGRGAKACALMIKAETGVETPLKEIEQQCEQMIYAWKTVTFPTAWRYLEGCQQAVYDPGYVENPWGFRKTFHVRSGTIRKDFEREAGNFPIQSTVAQTVNIAADLIRRYRREHGMKFKIQNQIHDAIMLELPIEEKEECKKMFHETMGSVKIPLGKSKYFQLGCDIECYDRWGEKSKEQ